MDTLGGVVAQMEAEKLAQIAEAANLLPEGEDADDMRLRKYKIVPKRKGIQKMMTELMDDPEQHKALLQGIRIIREG